MSDNISLRNWLQNLENGLYDSNSTKVMISAGWYDWFCQDRSLYTRFKSLVPKVKFFCSLDIFNLDKTYVFFKNNCPVYGQLYDSFSFCDMDSMDVLFYVCPKTGHKNADYVSELVGFNSDLEFETIFKEYSWAALKKKIKENKEILKKNLDLVYIKKLIGR